MMTLGLIALGLGIGVLVASGPASGTKPAEAMMSAPAASGSFKIDGSHSSAIYKISHLGLSNFYGRFNKIDGSYTFDSKNPSSAVFNVTIDVDSIDSNNKQRDEHLKSPDFFSVKEFPTITFKSKEFRKVGDHFELVGDLTMLGKSKAVTAKVVYIGEKDAGERFGYRSGFEATFSIKRSEYGMKYGLDVGALGDDVEVIFAIEGIRQ